MEQQAEAVGLRFEADLANTILDDVAGEPGAMPLLQHALLELWKRRHGRWLRAEEYRNLGGVRQAIARTADAIYDQATQRRAAPHPRHLPAPDAARRGYVGRSRNAATPVAACPSPTWCRRRRPRADPAAGQGVGRRPPGGDERQRRQRPAGGGGGARSADSPLAAAGGLAERGSGRPAPAPEPEPGRAPMGCCGPGRGPTAALERPPGRGASVGPPRRPGLERPGAGLPGRGGSAAGSGGGGEGGPVHRRELEHGRKSWPRSSACGPRRGEQAPADCGRLLMVAGLAVVAVLFLIAAMASWPSNTDTMQISRANKRRPFSCLAVGHPGRGSDVARAGAFCDGQR